LSPPLSLKKNSIGATFHCYLVSDAVISDATSTTITDLVDCLSIGAAFFREAQSRAKTKRGTCHYPNAFVSNPIREKVRVSIVRLSLENNVLSYSTTTLARNTNATKMGILERIRRNMRRSTRGTKDSLSIVSTCDETYYIGDHQEESYLLFSDEPLSPHHGVITTTAQVPKSSNKPNKFFDDDLPERDDEQLLGLTEEFDFFHLQASDEERDDARLLNSTSNGSGKRNFAYSFDEYEEEEIIFVLKWR
jgi:hypothetical protein